MGNSTSCDDSISISTGFKSCLYTCEESIAKNEQSYNNIKKNVKEIVILEDIDISSTSEEDERLDGSVVEVVEELGYPLVHPLQAHDPPEPLSVTNPTLNPENICNQIEVQPLSSDTNLLEGVAKCASILCSEHVQLDPVNYDAGDGFLCMTVPNEKFSEAEKLAFVYPVPTARKLVSAIKGSRALHGMQLKTDLSVKWAPDVYNPPITSSSHTAKGPRRHHHHYNHAKTKKDYYDQKHHKGKSSKGSVNERKHAHRRSSSSRSSLSDPRTLRLQALGCDKPLPNSCGQSKIEPLELDDGSHEAIVYGSRMESHPLVQLPLAKAS